MNSLILQIASKYIKSILLLFAILALLRGHNHPGGGFIGGLLAALSIVFSGLAYTNQQALKKLRIKPEQFIGIGLLFILLSFLPALLANQALMKGMWLSVDFFGVYTLKLGTPLLFDVGVFFAVIGVTLLFLFTLTLKK